MILQVNCTSRSGSRYDLGFCHGSQAKTQIAGSIVFYRKLFLKSCGMDWQTVKDFAKRYQSYLELQWPDYVKEMAGVASGAAVDYHDILALNVRTEIAFGAFNDGCTALSWKRNETSILAQNWDWNTDQAENLISLHITTGTGMTIQMITEAGIIGKIGMNNNGVGCTLNALKAKGVSFEKLPCHLALRTVMESKSRKEAVEALEKSGVASACHILIADETGGIGLECSSKDVVRLEMNGQGRVTHTNHFVAGHTKGVTEEPDWLPDTRFRLKRIEELLSGVKEEPNAGRVEELLKDEIIGDGAAIMPVYWQAPPGNAFQYCYGSGKKASEGRNG